MHATVRTVCSWLDEAYPARLAEDWDRVGLGCGDPDAEVAHVLFAVEVTDAVVAEAREVGAQLVVTHHPLLLRGVHAIRRDEPKGRVVMALVEAGISQFAAHTNADAARDGVSDALAATLGLERTRALTSVPVAAPEEVVALTQPDSAEGLGRIGVLPEPLSAAEVGRRLAAALPATAGGVRLGGDPDRIVRTVAVVGGAGDSFLDTVRATDADLYVTSDLRHHPAQDFLAFDGAPVLLDAPHWATEWLWLPRADALVRARAEADGFTIATTVSRRCTDPWAVRY